MELHRRLILTAMASSLAVVPILAENDVVEFGRKGPHTRTIRVDCDAGDRLDRVYLGRDTSDSGLRGNRPVVVEIRGTCVGHLVVRRDNVTLRGSSTETAVLRGRESSPGSEPVVKAIHATGLRIENLTIEDGVIGIRLVRSSLKASDIRIRDTQVGVSSEDSQAVIGNSAIADGQIGLLAFNGSVVGVQNSTIEHLAYGTGSAYRGSSLSLFDCVVSEVGAGFHAFLGSQLLFGGENRITMTTPLSVLTLSMSSRAQVGGSLDAAGHGVSVLDDSSLTIVDGAELALGDEFYSILLGGSSRLNMAGQMSGDVVLLGFSVGDVSGELDGALRCVQPSDATCPGTVASSNCGSCGAAMARSAPTPELPDGTVPAWLIRLLEE
jgi:hypothetical protein